MQNMDVVDTSCPPKRSSGSATVAQCGYCIAEVPVIVGFRPGGLDLTFTNNVTLMEHVCLTDPVNRNSVLFPNDHLPDVHFIWTQHGTGFVDKDIPGG